VQVAVPRPRTPLGHVHNLLMETLGGGLMHLRYADRVVRVHSKVRQWHPPELRAKEDRRGNTANVYATRRSLVSPAEGTPTVVRAPVCCVFTVACPSPVR
jgi:hypothetical protein